MWPIRAFNHEVPHQARPPAVPQVAFGRSISDNQGRALSYLPVRINQLKERRDADDPERKRERRGQSRRNGARERAARDGKEHRRRCVRRHP